MCTMATRRVGNYYNWVNSLKGNYAKCLQRRTEEEEEEEAEETPTGASKVERVDWNIKKNAKNHKTNKYDLVHDAEPRPVLRRGQPFYLTVSFNDDFDLQKDKVVLYFKFGHKPSVSKGTLGVVVVENENFTRDKDEWDCRIDPGTSGNDLVVQVYMPANACVGIYHLEVLSGLWNEQDQQMNRYKDNTDCFILFNPWCRDDAVFLDDDDKLEEYVLNDKGKVYVGNHRRSRGHPWAFGQFDDVVLPVAVYLLEISCIADPERGNPVKVVRGISAGVNANDESGVLVGRWGKDYSEYSDGVMPSEWNGSVRILEQYVNSGYKPVKYGQCWVFSALVTTVCRALGIPCRSVTNFVSAHDTNSSLTIDKFFNRQGELLEGGPDGENWDSIWNFHVWNDVWMARNDLPPGYGGWQAIDSTPQEESDNKMQCGPVSLVAVRRGNIGLSYDVPFVFAEVNADVIHWVEDPKSEWGWSRVMVNRYHVGRSILTKKVGVDDDEDNEDWEDILDEYKNRDGSTAERLAIHNAVRGSPLARQYYDFKSDVKEDVAFNLIDIDKIALGQPFEVKVVARNESDESRTVTAFLSTRSVYSTGVSVYHVKKDETTFVLQPGDTQDVTMTVQYQEYWPKLVEQCMLKLYAICRVEETGQTFTDEDDFNVEKPKLDIQLDGDEFRARNMCQATFSFTNPLDVNLTECHLSVDGAGLMRPRSINIRGNVPPGEQFIRSIRFLPRVHGERKIIATFNSKELFDVNGSKTMMVLKRE